MPTVLVVTPAFPAKSVQDFIAYAKAQDGKLTHGSSGSGGTLGPAGLPKAMVMRLNADVNRILAQPDFIERLAGLGATVLGGTPEQVTALIRSDMAKYAKAIKDSGAKPD